MPRLIRRVVTWRLTGLGWLTLALSVALVTALVLMCTHSFLGIQRPVNSSVLVVPGMLPDSALEEIAGKMEQDTSLLVITIGGPIGQGSHLTKHKDYATLAASTLVAMGAPVMRIFPVPSAATPRDRTLQSALALEAWLRTSDLSVDSLNIITSAARARRTHLVFTRVLGPMLDVGIIPLTDPNYDPVKWWTSSEGARTTVGELIAYIYSFFFTWAEK